MSTIAERKVMYFKDPTFHEGLNYTVRWGSKWVKLDIGEKIRLTNTADENKPVRPYTNAIVVDVFDCAYRDIPAFVLEFEHDPTCNTFTGLNIAMKYAYPDFEPDECPLYRVTCVGFVIKDERNTKSKRKE